MNLEIQDTGLGKTDPYVITENGKVLAQSYPNENGEHFQAGLREIVDEIATLRAQLAEAVSLLSTMTPLVRLKYGNKYDDIHTNLLKAEKFLSEVTPA